MNRVPVKEVYDQILADLEKGYNYLKGKGLQSKTEMNEYAAAQTDYIVRYCSALHKDNFYAVQFHPEKSGEVGERILKNFLAL